MISLEAAALLTNTLNSIGHVVWLYFLGLCANQPIAAWILPVLVGIPQSIVEHFPSVTGGKVLWSLAGPIWWFLLPYTLYAHYVVYQTIKKQHNPSMQYWALGLMVVPTVNAVNNFLHGFGMGDLNDPAMPKLDYDEMLVHVNSSDYVRSAHTPGSMAIVAMYAGLLALSAPNKHLKPIKRG